MTTRLLGQTVTLVRRVRRRALMVFLRPLFSSHGRNFVFDPDGSYTYTTIAVGSDVYIGPGAHFRAPKSSITIGNKVLFGPGVTIMGGDHNSSQLCRFMFDVTEKRPEDDLPVVLEDDVWVGAGAIILKGVTIGRGAVVAAGALVARDVPPYSIVGGMPARLLKWRWSVAEILEHERALYPPEARLEAEYLNQCRVTSSP